MVADETGDDGLLVSEANRLARMVDCDELTVASVVPISKPAVGMADATAERMIVVLPPKKRCGPGVDKVTSTELALVQLPDPSAVNVVPFQHPEVTATVFGEAELN